MSISNKSGKINIQSQDALGTNYNENMGYITDWDAANTETAKLIDSFARAVINLTTNTYKDTVITYELSINETLTE